MQTGDCKQCGGLTLICELRTYGNRCENCWSGPLPVCRYDDKKQRVVHDPNPGKSEIAELISG